MKKCLSEAKRTCTAVASRRPWEPGHSLRLSGPQGLSSTSSVLACPIPRSLQTSLPAPACQGPSTATPDAKPTWPAHWQRPLPCSYSPIIGKEPSHPRPRSPGSMEPGASSPCPIRQGQEQRGFPWHLAIWSRKGCGLRSRNRTTLDIEQP